MVPRIRKQRMTPRQRHVRTRFCFPCSFCSQGLFSVVDTSWAFERVVAVCEDEDEDEYEASLLTVGPLLAWFNSSSSSESHPKMEEERRRWCFGLKNEPIVEKVWRESDF